jgi:hypothetical protein
MSSCHSAASCRRELAWSRDSFHRTGSHRVLEPFLDVGTAVHQAPAKLERRRAAPSRRVPVPQRARREPRPLGHLSDGEKFASLLPCSSRWVRTWRPRLPPCEKAFGDARRLSRWHGMTPTPTPCVPWCVHARTQRVSPGRRSSCGQQRWGVVTKVSPWSVADTVTRLAAVVDARKMKMFAVIDHSGGATNEGLRDTKLVIFGSPTAGSPVMPRRSRHSICRSTSSSGPTIHDEDSYTAPRALAARYRLSDDLTDRLAGVAALTDAVIKG